MVSALLNILSTIFKALPELVRYFKKRDSDMNKADALAHESMKNKRDKELINSIREAHKNVDEVD